MFALLISFTLLEFSKLCVCQFTGGMNIFPAGYSYGSQRIYDPRDPSLLGPCSTGYAMIGCHLDDSVTPYYGIVCAPTTNSSYQDVCGGGPFTWANATNPCAGNSSLLPAIMAMFPCGGLPYTPQSAASLVPSTKCARDPNVVGSPTTTGKCTNNFDGTATTSCYANCNGTVFVATVAASSSPIILNGISSPWILVIYKNSGLGSCSTGFTGPPVQTCCFCKGTGNTQVKRDADDEEEEEGGGVNLGVGSILSASGFLQGAFKNVADIARNGLNMFT